ncbi:MAG: DUF47 domain-containing protein [Spirochaetaceae bacterium]|nr:MAG: DUF47 domain-containing protein [Spirochaetaceae bacterium]
MIFGKSKEENFFDMFKVQAEYAKKAADKLDDLIMNYTDKETKCRVIEDLEHEADGQVQKIYAQLNTAFITPIDREDIFMLAKRFDQVTDTVDSAAQRFLMYNVLSITEEAKAFSHLIVKCCNLLIEVVTELKHFKKVNKIRDGIIKVNALEHDGDILYHNTVKALFQKEHDPLYVVKWKEMYRALEDVLDACEDSANTILGVVLKNS